MKRRLIGKVNKESIKIGNVQCQALLDSGSVISCISEDFYRKYFQDYHLRSLDSVFGNQVKVTSASNNTLNILGFIEIVVNLPGTSKAISSLITVVSDSILSNDMPVLIGSNILDSWKRAILQNSFNKTDFSDHGTSSSNTLIIPSVAVVPLTANTCNAVTDSSVNAASVECSSQPTTDHVIQNNKIHDSITYTDFLDLFNLEKCPPEYKDELKSVLWRNRESFAVTPHDIGKCNITKHDMELSDYTPIKQKYRRIPPNMFNAVKEELEKLHGQGVIRPSMSPWCSPVSIAVKSDGSPRLCLDLRKVNDRTKKDAKSIPNVQEMFDRLAGKTIFSSLDLYSGFLQIELEERCREITAFTCGPLGFWEMNRMPFGACNSSATFQRTMEIVLAELLHKVALVYIDDIIVHSSSPQEHIQSLDKIFKRLSQHGLR